MTKMKDALWRRRINRMFQEQQRNGEPDGPTPRNVQKVFWQYQRKKFNKMFDNAVGNRLHLSNETKNIATIAFIAVVFVCVDGYRADVMSLTEAVIWFGISFLLSACVHLNIHHYIYRRADWLMVSSDSDFVDVVKVEIREEDESKFTVITAVRKYSDDDS